MLAERIKRARETIGLSQSQVAKELGITQPAYSYIENGDKNPSLPVAKKLAIVLNTSLDYLTGIKEDK